MSVAGDWDQSDSYKRGEVISAIILSICGWKLGTGPSVFHHKLRNWAVSMLANADSLCGVYIRPAA